MKRKPSGGKAPAFQFYPGDWLSSQRVQLMSLEEEGAYIRLLCYCWNHGSIPADVEKLTRLLGKGGSTTLASMVATMFQPDASNPEILKHDRLEEEREKQSKWKEKSAEGGKKSAEKRKNSRVVEPPLKGWLENGGNQKATLQSSSSSSSSSSNTPISPEGTGVVDYSESGTPAMIERIISAYPQNGNVMEARRALALLPESEYPDILAKTKVLAEKMKSLPQHLLTFCPRKHTFFQERRWNDDPSGTSWTFIPPPPSGPQKSRFST